MVARKFVTITFSSANVALKKSHFWLVSIFLVAPAGIEPATQGFSVLCSTDWAMKPSWRFVRDLNPWSLAWQASVIDPYTNEPLVAGVGFEPTTFGLWARRATKLLPSRDILKIGGGKGIRTPAPISRPVGFQDRSLQPDLGIPPCILWMHLDYNKLKLMCQLYFVKKISQKSWNYWKIIL